MKTAQRAQTVRAAPPREFARLRARLTESEETLRAIRSGEVDTMMGAGKRGSRVFTLEGAGHAYRMLIESMNEGALTLTAGKTILYANQCFARMVQCPLEQVIGGSFQRFLSKADRTRLQPLMKLADPSGSKIQVWLAAGDGSQIPVQISIRPLAKDEAETATMGMVVTDMTEARRAASLQETARLYEQVRQHADELERRVDERTRQLHNANQELEAFESSVSHDLRAPLHSVTGYAHYLLKEYAPQLPEGAQAFINKIIAGAGKMELLINALLEFSRLGKQELTLQPVDIGRMWRELLTEMTAEIGGQRVEVTIAELPPCQADPALLRQVLVNLLGNALKYSRTRECSVIGISSLPQPDGGGAAYCIKDNGVGFDMSNADKLFTVFQRLHDVSEFEGTGVGLTTAQRIIQRHGGRIWAESAPEAGASFFFTVGTPPPEVAHAAASGKVKTSRTGRK